MALPVLDSEPIVRASSPTFNRPMTGSANAFDKKIDGPSFVDAENDGSVTSATPSSVSTSTTVARRHKLLEQQREQLQRKSRNSGSKRPMLV